MIREQRSQIEELMSSGLSQRQIGEIVGVHASTVSRELRRNNIRGRYNYVMADEISVKRRHNASTQFKKIKNQLEKVRIGDWEGDTIISHGSHCALLTLVDRHSKYTIIRKVGRKTSENLSTAIIKSLKNEGLPVYTITFDNGSEFAEHQRISKKLKTNIYFARPYKSSDRGLNEHTNGLIRQFLPKNFDFKNVSDHDIKIIQNFLNSRHRKVLNYLAPVEVILDLKNTTPVAFHS